MGFFTLSGLELLLHSLNIIQSGRDDCYISTICSLPHQQHRAPKVTYGGRTDATSTKNITDRLGRNNSVAYEPLYDIDDEKIQDSRVMIEVGVCLFFP